MANNYRQFSEILKLESKEEADWYREYFLKKEQELDTEDEYLEFQYSIEEDNSEIWFYAEEYGNVENVAELVQTFLKHFNKTTSWVFTWADTCSKPRSGEFGGGAAYVTSNSIEYWDAYSWVTSIQEGSVKID